MQWTAKTECKDAVLMHFRAEAAELMGIAAKQY
jgi:hypothetical protein